jgi:hypothetical protein
MKAYNQLIKIAYENPEKREKILGLLERVAKDTPEEVDAGETYEGVDNFKPPLAVSFRTSPNFPLYSIYSHLKEDAGPMFKYFVQVSGSVYKALLLINQGKGFKKSSDEYRILNKFIGIEKSVVSAAQEDWRKIFKYYALVANSLVEDADKSYEETRKKDYNQIFNAVKKNLKDIGGKLGVLGSKEEGSDKTKYEKILETYAEKHPEDKDDAVAEIQL